MYDLPPPSPVVSHVMPIADTATHDALIIAIDKASYDKEKKLARIDMSEAFKKSGIIQNYSGATITLVYKDSDIDFKSCPQVHVPLKDIDRNIHVMDDTVSIYISNIEPELAEKIRTTLCLLVNSDTVKAVSAPVFPPPEIDDDPYNHLNK